MPAIVKCPTCAAAVEWLPENRFRPFCSERCKNIDLGAWSSEQFSIPADTPPDPMDEGDRSP
ncbi:MAG: DNA gyrase inhibitor YacG [Burkholderiaceae bacterium]|jgi:endogenous inhibitor of DNA gyrase (YacG/DUF329 family)